MQDNNQVYLISGLGADKRAFQNLNLDFRERVKHIEWISPMNKESIESYCKRLIDTYSIKENSVVIGLSFGGITAIELSKQVKFSKIILISSARNRYDLPLSLRLMGKLKLTTIIPKKALGHSNPFVEKTFGVKEDKEKDLLKLVLGDTDTSFAKWAIKEISTWKETGKHDRVIRIHGDSDKLIPLKNHVNYVIKNGTHFMIIQKSDEISEILNKELSESNT